MKTKTLLLDIETAPNKAYVWGFFNQNIALNQIEASGYVLCWSAKWYGSPKVYWQSIQHQDAKKMLTPMHKLLSEADMVVHYYGSRFDIPTLQKEFLMYGFPPPAPFKQIDLKVAVARAFKFESNKLDFVAGALGLGSKVRHPGMEMWVKCMNGDPEAWKRMKEYNIGDVHLLDKLYPKLLPWLERHPNMAVFNPGREVCPKCGSSNVQRRGTIAAITRRYHRFQCQSCAGWFRGTVSLPGQAARTQNVS